MVKINLNYCGKLKWMWLLFALTLSGCIGDKATFSEVAEAVRKDHRICFEVQHISDYTLTDMTIFKRGQSENREIVAKDDMHVVDSKYVCVSQALSERLSDGEYIVRFSLQPIRKNKNLRIFSSAIKINGVGVENIPLNKNEITHYLGRHF